MKVKPGALGFLGIGMKLPQVQDIRIDRKLNLF